MENVTGGGWTDETQLLAYKISVAMWLFFPPFIFLLGTFGNLTTILVMNRIKDNNSSQYVILMALAMADLCLLYSGLLVTWVYRNYQLYLPSYHTVLCKLYKWVLYASNTSSAWLVTTVTVQRTMAVLWPHRMRVMCTVRRTWVTIAVVVATAFSVHLHIAILMHLNEINQCLITGKFKQFYYFTWQWVDMCISSIAPSICLIVCSFILSWTLFRSTSLLSTAVSATSNVNASHSQDSRKSNAMKVTVMILSLSSTFLFLTLPVCIYNIWIDTGNVYTPTTKALSSLFSSLVFLMWYTNSAVNFLLYCITGARFRKEFLSLLCCGTKGRTVSETRPSGG